MNEEKLALKLGKLEGAFNGLVVSAPNGDTDCLKQVIASTQNHDQKYILIKIQLLCAQRPIPNCFSVQPKYTLHT